MITVDPWCSSEQCEKFFPDEVLNILDNEADIRGCKPCDCKCCEHVRECVQHYKCQRFDYVSIIHDFIHGKLKSIHDLSLYTGDQLFDNSLSQEIYLWTPIIIHIIKEILKIK